MKKTWLIIAGFTLLHLFVTIVAGISALTMGMGRFDTGAPMTLREHAWSTLANILFCPLGALSTTLHLEKFEPIWLLANSVLWGIALYWGGTLLFRRKTPLLSK